MNESIEEARKQIGLFIKGKRKQLKISQAQIAKDLNLRQATISIIENGKGNYYINTLLLVCDYLEIKSIKFY